MLLSVGAIYSLIPVFVILGLILAASSLARGTNILELFGVGTLLGLPAGSAQGGSNVKRAIAKAKGTKLLYTTELFYKTKEGMLKPGLREVAKGFNKLRIGIPEPSFSLKNSAYIALAANQVRDSLSKSQKGRLARVSPIATYQISKLEQQKASIEAQMLRKSAQAAGPAAQKAAAEKVKNKNYLIWLPRTIPGINLSIPFFKRPERVKGAALNMLQAAIDAKYKGMLLENTQYRKQVIQKAKEIYQKEQQELKEARKFIYQELSSSPRLLSIAQMGEGGAHKAQLAYQVIRGAFSQDIHGWIEFHRKMEIYRSAAPVIFDAQWNPKPGEVNFEKFRSKWFETEVDLAYNARLQREYAEEQLKRSNIGSEKILGIIKVPRVKTFSEFKEARQNVLEDKLRRQYNAIPNPAQSFDDYKADQTRNNPDFSRHEYLTNEYEKNKTAYQQMGYQSVTDYEEAWAKRNIHVLRAEWYQEEQTSVQRWGGIKSALPFSRARRARTIKYGEKYRFTGERRKLKAD